jgi:hypothetical protein
MPRTVSKPKPLPKPQPKPKISRGEVEVPSGRPKSLDEDVAREMDELALLLGDGDLTDLANIPEAGVSIDTLRTQGINRDVEEAPQAQVLRPTQPSTQLPPQFDAFGESTLLASLEELDQLHKKLK